LKRNTAQWLEMISRVRPSAFAVTALEREFTLNAVSDDLAETEMLEIRNALEQLSNQVLETRATPTSTRPQMTIDYRAEGMGGQGRLYLEIAGREQLEPLESEILDDLKVYVFTDGSKFAGLQVDDANTLADRLEPALNGLSTLELEVVDCLEANLEQVGVGEVLTWAVKNRISR
jgi:hypothetical protein